VPTFKEHPLNATVPYKVTLYPTSGRHVPFPAGTFDGDETFLLQLWLGDDQTPALSSSTAVEWHPDSLPTIEDEGNPALRVTITREMLEDAEILPGTYYIILIINPGTDDIPALEAKTTITFTAVPGTGTAILAYSSYQQVKDRVSWIEQVMPKDSDIRTDLGEQRVRAFDWVNEQLVSRDRERKSRNYLNALDMDLLVDWDTDYETTLQLHEADLRAALDAGGLLNPPAALIDAAALKAAAYALESQIGREPTGKTSYRNMADDTHRDANHRLLTVGDVGVDTDDDDEVDYWIRG
jgi:hypothetical protein